MEKSSGYTSSEKYLYRLCLRSFLSLWSYSNVFKDQRIAGSSTDGKEVCDLLVAFDNNVVIFSDKECAFPETGNLRLDWNRWYRRAIGHSAKQLRGAERWIKEHPDRLFLDAACTQPFPLPLPPPSDIVLHRIIVAHGAAERCMRELGGSGSLILDYRGRTLSETPEGGDVPEPFTIGRIGTYNEVYHVLDDNTLGLILGKLDTIRDFVVYLDKKEQLLESGVSVFAAGEEDMLAHYLWHMNEHEEHDFVFDSTYDGVFFEEGSWKSFEQSDQRREQILADRISYAWDRLIELVAEDLEYSRLRHPTLDGKTVGEQILRYMARESRFRRRMLARAFIDLTSINEPHFDRYARTVPATRPDEPYYLFMTLRKPDFVDIDTYREVRQDMLHDYCRVLRLRFPSARDIVGIATELGELGIHSIDVVYFDGRSFTSQDRQEAEELAVSLNMYQNAHTFQVTELEYPEPSQIVKTVPRMKGRTRNGPCPCGSGKKFKHCCGKSQMQSPI